MGKRKIDKDRLRKMIDAGSTYGQIAAAFDCTEVAVSKFVTYHGMARPNRPRNPRATSLPPDEPAQAAIDVPPHLAGLAATGGRYADLAKWAAERGMTATRSLQEWHRLGLPIRKGASA